MSGTRRIARILMKEKLSFSLFYVGFLAAIVAMLLTAGAFRSSISEQTVLDLKQQGFVVANAYELIDSAEQLKKFTTPTLRITLISPEGKVLFESEAEKESMDSHFSRPEVLSAIRDGDGSSFRLSHTLETDVYYYAKLLPDGNVLRLSIRKSSAFSVISSVYPKLIILLIAILLFSLFFAYILSNRFVAPIRRLAENLDSVQFPEGDLIYKEFTPFAREIKRERDNTAREMSRLKFERNRFRTLIEDMSEGMILLDSKSEVVLVNSVAREMFHVEGDFTGRNVRCFSRNIPLNSAVESASGGKKADAEIQVAGKDVRLIASPVFVGGEVSGVIVILLDVTEKKNLSDLREKFTANASHELKTPLTSIVGYAELIESGMAKPEDIPEFARKIHKESARLIALTNDIMKLSELDEANPDALSLERVNLCEMLKEIVSMLEPLAAKRRISVSAPTEDFFVMGDKGKLFEMFYNLVVNAIRYNRDSGSVTVAFEGNSVVVKDTGVGIAEEHLPHIFERFYRADKSRSKETGGTGLGLAIVKHIAELHQAKVSVSSVFGEGSVFRVDFPSANASLPTPNS